MRCRQTNGFMERFDRAVVDEIFWVAFSAKFFKTVECCKPAWTLGLAPCNTGWSHEGYPKMGRTPLDTIKEGCATVASET